MTTLKHTIDIDGDVFPILIRKHKRSRRIVLRYHPTHRAIGLTLPRYATIRQGLDFIESSRDWIAREVSVHRKKIHFEQGAEIPVLGAYYTLTHVGGRGTIKIEGNTILVPGEKEFMARRVKEWLKKTAQDHLGVVAKEKARELNVRIARITVRDTRSHWGSCSHAGRLSFSWRLIFAPVEVFEYVVCHEVAHLKELNHSPAFWRHVASICPHWRESRKWLKGFSSELHKYG